MKKEDRERILAAFMVKRHPQLKGRLSIDFRRSKPRPEGNRKLFRARKNRCGISLDVRCHPKEDDFKRILRRAADASAEILSGTSNATEIGEREREVRA